MEAQPSHRNKDIKHRSKNRESHSRDNKHRSKPDDTPVKHHHSESEQTVDYTDEEYEKKQRKSSKSREERRSSKRSPAAEEDSKNAQRKQQARTPSRPVQDTFDDTGYHRNPADDTSTLSELPTPRRQQAEHRSQHESKSHRARNHTEEPEKSSSKSRPSRGEDTRPESVPKKRKEHTKPRIERPHTTDCDIRKRRTRDREQQTDDNRDQHSPATDQGHYGRDAPNTDQRPRTKDRGIQQETKEERRERKQRQKEEKARTERNTDMKSKTKQAKVKDKPNKPSILYQRRLCFSDSELDTLGKIVLSEALKQDEVDERPRDRIKSRRYRVSESDNRARADIENTAPRKRSESVNTRRKPADSQQGVKSNTSDPLYDVILKFLEKSTSDSAKAKDENSLLKNETVLKSPMEASAGHNSQQNTDDSKRTNRPASDSSGTRTKLMNLLFQRVKDLLTEVESLSKEKKELKDKIQERDAEIARLRKFEDQQLEREKRLTEKLEILVDDVPVTAKGTSFNQKVQGILKDIQNKYCNQWKEHEDRMKQVQDEAEREIQHLMRDIVSKYADISEIKGRTDDVLTATAASTKLDELPPIGQLKEAVTTRGSGDYRNGYQQPNLAGLRNTNDLLLKIAEPLKPLSIQINGNSPNGSNATRQSKLVPGQHGNEREDSDKNQSKPFYEPLSLKMDAQEFWRHKLLQPVEPSRNNLLRTADPFHKTTLPPITTSNSSPAETSPIRSTIKRMAI